MRMLDLTVYYHPLALSCFESQLGLAARGRHPRVCLPEARKELNWFEPSSKLDLQH